MITSHFEKFFAICCTFQTNGGPGSFTTGLRASEGVGGGGGAGAGGGVNTPSGTNDIYQG